jgi:uncharacterized OB-fold protein
MSEILPPKPLPVPSALAKPFWDALQQGELRLQRCGHCGHCNHPPLLICPKCHHRELSWEKVATTGTLYSYTIVYRPPMAAFKQDVPYGVGLVDVDGTDARLLTNILGPVDTLHIGMRLELVFEMASDDITLFKYKKLEATP